MPVPLSQNNYIRKYAAEGSQYAVTRNPAVVTWLNNHARRTVNNQLTVIKMPYDEYKSTQSFCEADLTNHHQITAVTLEHLVLLLLEYNDDISWLYSWLHTFTCTMASRVFYETLLHITTTEK